MTRPKVVHVVVAGEVGGAERMLCSLAGRPDATGADHAVALMTPSEELARTLGEAGLRVRDRGRVREDPAAFLWRSLGPLDVRWLARVLDEEAADLVQVHTFASQVLGARAARRRGLPVLRTEHSTRVYDDASCWPFSRWSLARADGVAFVSDHVRRVAAAKTGGALPAHARVVHNGIDVERFALAPPPESEAPFTVVAVARLDRRKGLDLALDALALAPGIHLDVVGGGAEGETRGARAAAGRRRARALRGPSTIRGPRSRRRTRPLFVAHRGPGVANLRPWPWPTVVAFATGGVPEIVRDGVTGWLVPEGDVGALAAGLRAAAQDPSATRARGAAARNAVVERFSVDAMCRAYGSLYEALLHPRFSAGNPGSFDAHERPG